MRNRTKWTQEQLDKLAAFCAESPISLCEIFGEVEELDSGKQVSVTSAAETDADA